MLTSRSLDLEMKLLTNSKTKVKVKIPKSQTEVKPKKKKKSTALVVPGAEGKKIKMTELRSYFGKQAPVILRMIEMNDNDGGLTLLKKKLLQTTISLVPFAEDIIRNSSSQRGIYQFTALVSQVRELITDIRADEDRRHVARSIIEEVIRPAFMEIAQNIITDHHDFRKVTERMVKPEASREFNEKLQGLAKELAKKMMEIYKDVEHKTQEQLRN